ncbi:cysteine hydrolase family protein [Hypoxylon sp. NC0597]|nr:cysteine hydrolase family protein [Hypoxylon sp. NC0597]
MEEPLTFGKNYAVLNLDLMAILIDSVKHTPEGRVFISNCSRWNDAVHKEDPQPLVIFTTLFFNPGRPELAEGKPFHRLIDAFDLFEAGSAAVQITRHFMIGEKDIVLQKTRWYAGAGNGMEQILKAQNIDTVILSGLSLSGVVMSTVYRLFDLDYHIYVISDNVLELPTDHHENCAKVMLDTLLPKMNVKVITLDQALRVLERS